MSEKLNYKRDVLVDEKRPTKIKHSILNNIYPFENRAKALLRILRAWLILGKLPGSSKMHPLLKPKNNQFTNVPMNIKLPVRDQEVPVNMIHKLIDESDNIHVMDHCICRTGENCKEHRHDIGCLFLGDTGLDVAPQLSCALTKEEAYAHVQAALNDGLLPMTARLRADNYAFLLPDRHRLIAICFCCDCCCFMSYYRHASKKYTDLVYRLVPGAKITVDSSKCANCTSRECIEHCYMKNISYVDDRAFIGPDCRTCGRCSLNCPHDAIDFYTDDSQAIEKMTEHMLDQADLKSSMPS